MIGVIATLLALSMGVPDEADVRGAVRRVYQDERLQQEWPGPEAPLETPPQDTAGRRSGSDPGRVDDRAPGAHGRRARLREPSRRSDPSPVWKAVMWILVAIGAAWILVTIVTAFRTRRRDVKAPASPEAPAVAAAEPRSAAPRTPAEALAAEGRYGEAIHALWLDALAVIGRGGVLDPGLTSREVLDRLRLPSARRDAAVGLVGAVEVSLFGGRQAGEAEWLASAERHRVATAAGSA